MNDQHANLLRDINTGLQVLRTQGAATKVTVENEAITADIDLSSLMQEDEDFALPMLPSTDHMYHDWNGTSVCITYLLQE